MSDLDYTDQGEGGAHQVSEYIKAIKSTVLHC